MIEGTTVAAICEDGVELRLRRAEPVVTQRRCPPVLMVHGTFSNASFFLGGGNRGMARFLAARGIDAWVAELRGHSRSGDAAHGQSWDFEHWIRHDAPTLIRSVLEATGSRSLIWLGHSAGGAIGVAYAGLGAALSDAIAGLIMIATPAPGRPGAWHVPLAAIGYGITRVVGHFPARALRIGPADEHGAILQQWMGWNLSRRWSGTNETDFMANAGRIHAPALALAGSGDIVAPPAACRRLLDALGSADRTMVVCGRRAGFSRRYTHNRLVVSNDARQEVWPVITDWLEQRFP